MPWSHAEQLFHLYTMCFLNLTACAPCFLSNSLNILVSISANTCGKTAVFVLVDLSRRDDSACDKQGLDPITDFLGHLIIDGTELIRKRLKTGATY